MWRPPQRRSEVYGLGRTRAVRRPKPPCRAFSRRSISGRARLPSARGCRAMVPWRATDDGDVTRGVIDWYAGSPRQAGRARRRSDRHSRCRERAAAADRRRPFLAGCARWCRRARGGGGETRLFIQLIDFLAIRRRPDPHKFSSASCDHRRASRGAGGRQPTTPSARPPRRVSDGELDRVSGGGRTRRSSNSAIASA